MSEAELINGEADGREILFTEALQHYIEASINSKEYFRY
jgi:hypothetical protein